MSTATERTEKLVRVRIEGFRSIAFADLELRGVNVFVGANGAGKSSFIGFLQMLRYMMGENLPFYVNQQRGANSLLHFGNQRTPRMAGNIQFQRQDARRIYGFDLVSGGGDRLLFLQEGFVVKWLSGSPDSVVSFGVGGLDSAVPKKALSSKDAFEKDECKALQKSLLGIRTYHFHNSTLTSPLRGFQSMRENLALLSQGENTAVMALRMREEFPLHYERLIDEMRRILPEFRNFVLEPDPSRDGKQIELRWVGWHSEYALGPDQLSDGSIRAVSLLTLLLQPDEWKPGIIVIDEPELGLHPFAVGQIGRLIAEAGVTRQVIVSTQSPGLVAQFEPEDVVVVESENGASTFRRLDPEDLGGWLEAYDGDLGRLFEMNVMGGAPQ